jgi:uncharacterized protein (TIGR02594 family)
MIEDQYRWLLNETGPRILKEALSLYGTEEFKGEANNPVILMWSKELRDHVGIEYKADATPWCGLFMGVVAKRAGYEPPFLCIRAKEWLKFGNLARTPMLGDVLVFERKGGGHVGLYVGENNHYYYVLGGNQRDRVCIVKMDKVRCIGARRCPWRIGQPSNVRKIILDLNGHISYNEA